MERGSASKKPVASPRLRVIRAIHALPHRYSHVRWLTQGVTFAILFATPLLGIARFDLWDGRHLFARRAVDSVYGAGGLFMGMFIFYGVTFALNAVMGRVFCGFGCPMGQASRFGDDVEAAARTGKGRLRAEAQAVGFALAFAAASGLWLVSPWVFVEGSPRAIATTIAGFVGLAGLVYAHGRFWRWRFCEGFCPIGIYYSAVQTAQGFGIHFDAAMGTCKDCDSCSVVCPVRLDPRHLTAPKNDLGGIGIEGFPERNHCLTCGECVRACELQFKKEGLDLVPLRLSFRARPDEARAEAPPPADEGPQVGAV